MLPRINSLLNTILQKSKSSCLLKSVLNEQRSQFIRQSSYLSSRPVRDLKEYPEVEVCKNPIEWKYVERILAPLYIPEPVPKPSYPSGWKPPSPINENKKYFVARTKNHMIPVYLQVFFRGFRRITVVRLVQGDIWSLEKDLRKVIAKSTNGKPLASRINELSGQIRFHGDHVDVIREHLKSIGF